MIITKFPVLSHLLAPTSVGVSTERMSVLFSPARLVPSVLAVPVHAVVPSAVVNEQQVVTSFFPSLTVKRTPCVVAVSPEHRRRVRPLLRVLRAGESSVGHEEPLRFIARKGGKEMPRRTPESRLTVDAISDARRYLMAMFLGNDDRICEVEQGALLLIDTAAYRATRTDLHRRAEDNVGAYGEVTNGLQREYADADRDFAHVLQAA